MPTQKSSVCYVYGVGAWGLGFADWPQLRALLSGAAPWPQEPVMTPPKSEVIPGNERRRAPTIVKAAVEVAGQACQQAGMNPSELACVFGSGLGDTDITDYLCAQLALPEKQLSPTKFHNSVHNAPAGYWTISTHCMQAANSIAAYQHTVGITLMEAVLQAHQEQTPVLLCVFDLTARGIYEGIYETKSDFAAALVITPNERDQPPLAKLQISTGADVVALPAWDATFAKLQRSNPAAQILPLLHALANKEKNPVLSLSLSEACRLKVAVEQ